MWVPVVVRHVANCYTLFTFTLPLPKYHTAVLCPVWWLIWLQFCRALSKMLTSTCLLQAASDSFCRWTDDNFLQMLQSRMWTQLARMTRVFAHYLLYCKAIHNIPYWNDYMTVSVIYLQTTPVHSTLCGYAVFAFLYNLQSFKYCFIFNFHKIGFKSVLLVYFFVLFLIEIGFMHWKW